MFLSRNRARRIFTNSPHDINATFRTDRYTVRPTARNIGIEIIPARDIIFSLVLIHGPRFLTVINLMQLVHTRWFASCRFSNREKIDYCQEEDNGHNTKNYVPCHIAKLWTGGLTTAFGHIQSFFNFEAASDISVKCVSALCASVTCRIFPSLPMRKLTRRATFLPATRTP